MKNSVKSCSKNLSRIKWLYISAFLLLIFSIIASILSGSTKIDIKEVINAFSKGFNHSADTKILGYVRLPRTIASILCGSALAVSGYIIQEVLGNKLASPGVIGVNSGAGFAVTLCVALNIYGGFRLSLFSFLGAFCSVMLVNSGAKKWGGSKGTVILIGVALNSLLGAASDTIITFIPEVGVMSNDFKVGEFSAVTYNKLLPASILIILALFFTLTLSNELEVLSLGENTAKSLGMNTSAMRFLFLTLTALLAGCAVSIAGLLSFVGLIVPHIVRRLAKTKALHLILLSTVFGGGFVCLCDTVARTVFAPYEIPVGIIMAFIGAPFFLFILIKGGGKND